MPASAGDLVVTRYFSGLWEQTWHENQGIVLQVIDQEDDDGDPKAVAYWFTYGDDQQSAWYIAIGEVEGNQVVTDLYASYNVSFLEPASAGDPVEKVGTLTLTFMNCNKGTGSYTLENGQEPASGEFEIRRLAALYNSRCSGGISDNTPADAKPLMLQVDLMPPEEGSDGKGKAKFWERSDRSDFHVSVEYLAPGFYDVGYCDVRYAEVLEVVDGEGAVQFRSPEADGKLLLIEDPRDCPIEVWQGESLLVLTSGDAVLGDKVTGPKDKDDEDKISVEVDFESTGVIDGARGEAEYEIEGDESEFSVQIQGVPVGDYTLLVGDIEWGVLSVTGDGEKAKLKIKDPDPAPWGQMIEITVTIDDSDEVILWAQFPDSA
jgi:hypothetical protein